MIWVLGIALLLLLVLTAAGVLAVALCRAAARGDQALEEQLMDDDGRTADLRAQGEQAA